MGGVIAGRSNISFDTVFFLALYVFRFWALYFDKIALLLANFNREFFSCMLLGGKIYELRNRTLFLSSLGNIQRQEAFESNIKHDAEREVNYKVI